MIQVFKACPPFCHAGPLEEMSNSLGTLQLIQNSPSGLLLGLFIQQMKVLTDKKDSCHLCKTAIQSEKQ